MRERQTLSVRCKLLKKHSVDYSCPSRGLQWSDPGSLVFPGGKALPDGTHAPCEWVFGLQVDLCGSQGLKDSLNNHLSLGRVGCSGSRPTGYSLHGKPEQSEWKMHFQLTRRGKKINITLIWYSILHVFLLHILLRRGGVKYQYLWSRKENPLK